MKACASCWICLLLYNKSVIIKLKILRNLKIMIMMKICYLYINNCLPFSISGWHTRINMETSVKPTCPFTSWFQHFRESPVLSSWLVSEQQILRDQRTRYRDMEGRLHAMWDSYDDEQISASQLLRECGVVRIMVLVTKHSSFVNIVMNVTCKSCLFCTYFVVIAMNMMEMK